MGKGTPAIETEKVAKTLDIYVCTDLTIGSKSRQLINTDCVNLGNKSQH